MNFKEIVNISRPFVFRKAVPYNTKGHIEKRVTAHGFIDNVRVRFAAGENGTLRIRPVLIIPPEIEIDLFAYAGDRFIFGDNETIESNLSFEVETDAHIRIYYENTATDPETIDSIVDVNVGVTYYQMVIPENVIGPRHDTFIRRLLGGR